MDVKCATHTHTHTLSLSLTHAHTHTHSLYVVFPARAPSDSNDLTPSQLSLGIEAGEGRSAGTQAGYQLACLATTLALAIGGGLITGDLFRFSVLNVQLCLKIYSTLVDNE